LPLSNQQRNSIADALKELPWTSRVRFASNKHALASA
jgi:hypothetical protein